MGRWLTLVGVPKIIGLIVARNHPTAFLSQEHLQRSLVVDLSCLPDLKGVVMPSPQDRGLFLVLSLRFLLCRLEGGLKWTPTFLVMNRATKSSLGSILQVAFLLDRHQETCPLHNTTRAAWFKWFEDPARLGKTCTCLPYCLLLPLRFIVIMSISPSKYECGGHRLVVCSWDCNGRERIRFARLIYSLL